MSVALLATAGTANAGWEAPQRVDNQAPAFQDVVDGDIGVGANGLSTVLFWQTGEGQQTGRPLMVRRGGSETSYSAPQAVLPAGGNDAAILRTEIDAGPDGSARGAFFLDENVLGVSWPASADAPGEAQALSAAAPFTPQLGVDSAGNAYAVFVRQDDANNRHVYLVRYDQAADAWSEPEKVSVGIGQYSRPRIAVNGDGDLAVSYVQTVGGLGGSQTPVDKVLLRRKLSENANFDNGFKTVSSPDESQRGESVNEHDVAINAGGDIVVVYAEDPDRPNNRVSGQTGHRIWAKRWFAISSNPRDAELVSTEADEAGSASNPRIEVAENGLFTTVWQQWGHYLLFADARAQEQTLQSAESDTSGIFGPEQLVSSGDQHVAPGMFDLDVDRLGSAYVVYTSGDVFAAKRAPTKGFEAPIHVSNGGSSFGDTGGRPPRVAAEAADQADAFFTQAAGASGDQKAFTTRFRPDPAVDPPPPPPPVDPEDCFAGYNKIEGDDGGNELQGTPAKDMIFGRAGNDTLIGIGEADCLRAGSGDDMATGGDGTDVISGNDGDDKLSGDAAPDIIAGDAGSDVINGGADGDLLGGGADGDTIRGRAGDDIAAGDAGNDKIYASTGANTVSGGDGDDYISGGADTDTFGGDAGDDRIHGGGGADWLEAGEGSDRVRGGRQGDNVLGGAGQDALFGSVGGDTLLGGDDDDELYGGRGTDRVFGEEGSDRIRGGNRADRLIGGEGDDKLSGGRGKDRVFGSGGDDKLFGNSSRDRLSGGHGDDVLKAVDGRRDAVICGPGIDRVVAEAIDRVRRDCETVVRVPRKKRDRR